MFIFRLLLRRTGRRVSWRNPQLYYPFGLLRGRGDCLAEDFDLWIDGFPRSANTFCLKAFQMGNPTARVRCHRHIPPFIIHALDAAKPGMFLVRKPIDAACSWAIFWNIGLAPCLDYYIDFHQALRSRIPELFIVSFEQVTTRFERVIEKFNQRFGTSYASMPSKPSLAADCFAHIDRSSVGSGDSVNERTISRPSLHRAQLKPALLAEVQTQPALRSKLDRANGLYLQFRAGARAGFPALGSVTTGLVPTLT